MSLLDFQDVQSESKATHRGNSRRVPRKGNPKGNLFDGLKPTSSSLEKTVATDYGTVVEGTVTKVCNVAQGDEEYERIGKFINVKEVDFSSMMRLVPGPLDSDNITQLIREIVFIDKNRNGSTPSVSELFIYSSLAIDKMLSPVQTVNQDRFVFLRDRMFKLHARNYQAASGNVPSVDGDLQVSRFKRRLNIQQAYSGATAADINAGVIYYVWFSYTAANSQSASTLVHVTTRTKYEDA